jgi:hypothetical protein
MSSMLEELSPQIASPSAIQFVTLCRITIHITIKVIKIGIKVPHN